MELKEIRIGGDYFRDSMLPHEGRRVDIVKKISRRIADLADHDGQNFKMTAGRRQQDNLLRSDKSSDESESLSCNQRIGKYAGMGGNAQEFVDDRPGEAPGCAVTAMPVEKSTRRRMERATRIGRMQQNIRVDQEFHSRSIASKS